MFGADQVTDSENKVIADRALVEFWGRRIVTDAPTPQQVRFGLNAAGVVMNDELRGIIYETVAAGYAERIATVGREPQAIMDMRNALHDGLNSLIAVGISREDAIALRNQLNPPGQPTANEITYAL